jgi:hypothetical protein
MLFYISVIFAATALPILAVIVHMGNTGSVFLNRREVAGVLGVIAIFSGAFALAFAPEDRTRPLVKAIPVVDQSEVDKQDKEIEKQAKIDSHVAAILEKYGSATLAPSADKRFDALFYAKNLEEQLSVEERTTNWGMIHGKMAAIRSKAAVAKYNEPFEAENDRLKREFADMRFADKVIIDRGSIITQIAVHKNTVRHALEKDRHRLKLMEYNPPKPVYYSSGKVTTVIAKD